MMQLTAKQQRFVDEYLIDLNATAAATRAGYSRKSAKAIANENLTKPDIQAAIQAAMNRREKRTEITQDRVLQELGRIAFTDMRDYLQWSGSGAIMRPSDSLTTDQAVAIKTIQQRETEDGTQLKFQLHDKVGALEKLARHLGMFRDNVSVEGEVVKRIIVESPEQLQNDPRFKHVAKKK